MCFLLFVFLRFIVIRSLSDTKVNILNETDLHYHHEKMSEICIGLISHIHLHEKDEGYARACSI